MIAVGHSRDRLIDRLPAVRGRLQEDVALYRFAWFRVGGPAEVLFEPEDTDDLVAFLSARPVDVPVTIIGAASNLLIRDGGIPGVVIRLGRAFATIAVEENIVTAGAGAMDITVAREAAAAGLGGLEFLSGIPGSIGGAVRMNAGAYGREIKNVLVDIEAVDETGGRHRAAAADLGFEYRHSDMPDDWIVVSARLRGTPAAQDDVETRMAEIQAARESTQPLRSRTGGSTFKNPPGLKAWELIEATGCRGLVRGGARVSDQHCNFLINTGDATAADLEGLGEEVRRRVYDRAGIKLDWEIRRIGIPARGVAVEDAS